MNKFKTQFSNDKYKFSALKIEDPTKEYLISIIRIVNCQPLIQAVDGRDNELGYVRVLSFDPSNYQFRYHYNDGKTDKIVTGNESSMLAAIGNILNMGDVNIFIDNKLVSKYNKLLSMAEQFDSSVIVGKNHYLFLDYDQKPDMYTAIMQSPDRFPRKWYFFGSNQSLLLFNEKGFDIIQGQTINKLLC